MFVATQELSLDGIEYKKGDVVKKPTTRMIENGLVRGIKIDTDEAAPMELLTEVSEPIETSVEDEEEDEVGEDEEISCPISQDEDELDGREDEDASEDEDELDGREDEDGREV
jgi:hypothetical protein